MDRGPLIHAFHTFLDGVLFKGFSQTSTPVVSAKLLIDQLLFSPFFMAIYYYAQGLTEDRSLASTTQTLKTDIYGLMRKSWTVWVPANFVSYWLVPLDLRVLFGNLVGFFWNAYLISHATVPSQVTAPATS